MTAITGNTYPVKDALKALGARWNPDQKAWMIADEKAAEARKIVSIGTTSSASTPSYIPKECVVCGRTQRPGSGPKGHMYPEPKILRSGECVDCYEERKMGY